MKGSSLAVALDAGRMSHARSESRPDDRFERLYVQALPEAPPEDAREQEREASEGHAREKPDEPFALGGCVVTPERALDPGWVVVGGGAIAALRDTAPRDVRTIETRGVILPGLVDLHGHPEYNVFPAWEPPRLYENRYRWRETEEYAKLVKGPWHRLTDESRGRPSLLPTLTRYAEARALVGGTTAIQGASKRYPDPAESLVRNVDRHIFGRQLARAVDQPHERAAGAGARLRAEIASGEVKAFYVHLAEGIDECSRGEFDELVASDLLAPATVIIHGTALTDEQLAQVREAGAKMVWSPQSNLRLYGETTRAARALELGIPLGLGADWLPSGSPSLLDELRVARRSLERQGAAIEAKRLVGFVTHEGARVAALEDKLGALAEGRPADLLVLERHDRDPWESVLQADRRSIDLVVIGGDVAYGRIEWIDELAGASEREPVLAWGKHMALDLTYSVLPFEKRPPRLAELRAGLLARFPQTGPIFG